VTLPAVDVTVYPFECDAFGHLNQASCLAVLERARWDALARGPGMDVFKRHGVWPAARRTTIEYRAAAYAGDVLRVEMAVTDRGTTSFTMRHTARRTTDDVVIAEAEMVFVCIDRTGRPTPVPEEISRALGAGRAVPRDTLKVTVPGAELAVEVRGDGSPCVLVHGFPLDRTLWRHQLAALTRWKRIAPDLRGFGASGAPSDGYSMARYADDLVAVLDALRLEQAVFCGLSMGGYVLFELWRRHPQRVRALVLADTRADDDSPEGKRGRDEMIELAGREGAAGVAARMLPKLVAPTTARTQPEVVRQVESMILRTPVPGIVGALRAMRERPDSRPLLPAIAVPTLVVVGADDELTPPAAARVLVDAIPGARYAEIPGAGHLAPLEQPLATTRVVLDFLNGLP
jgi:YbgC/YbaW family acyl-CoA thioester hydrolase